MTNSHKLAELLQLLVIAHHIPGRLRLNLVSVEQAQASGLALEDVERCTTALRLLDGVRGVTLNRISLSCLIDYNPEVLPQETWVALLSGDEHNRQRGLAAPGGCPAGGLWRVPLSAGGQNTRSRKQSRGAPRRGVDCSGVTYSGIDHGDSPVGREVHRSAGTMNRRSTA